MWRSRTSSIANLAISMSQGLTSYSKIISLILMIMNHMKLVNLASWEKWPRLHLLDMEKGQVTYWTLYIPMYMVRYQLKPEIDTLTSSRLLMIGLGLDIYIWWNRNMKPLTNLKSIKEWLRNKLVKVLKLFDLIEEENT